MKKIKIAALFFCLLIVSACTSSSSVTGSTSSTPRPTTPFTSQPTGTTPPVATNPPAGSTFTTDEVATHKTATDCWMIISGSVYNVTNYVNQHPGGSEILRGCGLDATSLYESKGGRDETHSSTSRRILETFKIGTVVN